MEARFLQALVTVLLTLSASSQDDEWSKNQKLRKILLKNYDKSAMPHRDANGTTTIRVWMRLRNFEFDDQTQILSVHSWLSMVWKDERLTWDIKDYGGLKMAHFGDSELWKPDLSVYNNADMSEVDHYGNVHLLVQSSGYVYWFPPALLRVKCPVDLTFWPFDQHVCRIRLGSWSSHGWLINLQLATSQNETEVDRNSFIRGLKTNWNLLNATQKRNVYQYGRERYIDLEFLFTLKRDSPTFTAIAVVPAIVIPLLLLVQFVLPVDQPQRMHIGFVCAFLVMLELLFLKFSLPKVGTSVPLIVKYYSECLVIVVLTVGTSAVLSRIAHPQNPLLAWAPPELVKRFLTGPMAIVLCLRQHASKVGLSGKGGDEGEVLDLGKEANYSHEWLLVARAVDRVVMILCVCVFAFSLIAYVSPVK